MAFLNWRGWAYLLSVDLDEAVDDKLAGLTGTAGEQRAPDGRVEPALRRVVRHVHVRSLLRFPVLCAVVPPVSPQSAVESRAAAEGLVRSVGTGEHAVVHGHDGGQPAVEHAGPLAFADLLAVVGTCQRLCQPFLLEEGF